MGHDHSKHTEKTKTGEAKTEEHECCHHDHGAAPKHTGPVDESAIYTCPMHPEIEQVGSGTCPKCGMALEPKGLPDPDAGPDPELVDFTKRFWVGLVLTIPVLIIAMGPFVGLPIKDWIPSVGEWPSATVAKWIEMILGTPVVAWAGWPFFVRGWQSIINKSLNMFTLIAIGTGAALIYSITATVLPGIFPEAFQKNGVVEVYFEAAAVIVVLVLLGQVLELRARARTGGAIRALMDLSPKTARIVRENGEEEDIPLEHVMAGDLLRVRPGDK
ncbi:MAG: heavy metal translocating P-type ATPase, partial [Robiginitomaculum sp.]|nr:heavy metal translocating P-type ATPase [Robiginitomaculum sp.]